MTSRLKRKLGELGVDTSSRKANENFCLIGTPLPPLEKSKDTGEFVPLWKQEVRDEKGRRRLHGAFTGGWSAGYFNTVGSKEGWTPSTFVSSRVDRAKKQAAPSRPEDFMDEEDLQDLKDSRKIVDTTEEMEFLAGTQAELRSKANDEDIEADPITLTLQTALLPPPKFSIGAQILQKMGWRVGQGIGPRIPLARRRAQDTQAYDPFTGTRLTTGSLEIQEEDEEAKRHLYAPRDVPILSVQRKGNSHGLGYVPGTSLHSSSKASSSSSHDAAEARLAGGFGLGALNDADEDDLDVYDNTKHSTSSPRRVAYDHTEGLDDDDTVLIGSSSGRGTGKTKGTNSSHATKSSSHFRDGRAVLQGFVLSDESVAQDKWFPLPDIPPGWTPNPHSIWHANKEHTNAPPPGTVQHTQGQAQSHGKWKSSQLSADQRGSLIGETPLPSGPTKSVFDYMSEKDRERVQRIASTLKGQGPGPSANPFSTTATEPPPPLIHLDPHVAQAALQGFQPFTADPVKQTRYTTFLQSFASGSTTPSLQPPPGQTNEEFTKELSDFSKAATLFKPMSGAMQGRFTSASVLDMGPQNIEGLHVPSSSQAESEGKGKEEAEKEEPEQVDPKANAAKMGMYGPLTREVRPWVPARLLCKRFGVREPDVSLESMTEVTKAAQSSELSVVPSSTSSGTASSMGVAVGADITPPGRGPRDITNLGLGEDETQGRDILTYQRPSLDVFKAIFASDDEETEENEDQGGEGVEGDEGKAENGKGGFTRATIVLDDETPVDPETFKPKFVPRPQNRDRGGEKEDQEKERAKEKKDKREKKDKKKDRGKVLVSFEMEEGDQGEGDHSKRSKEDRPAKKRRKDRKREKERGGDENNMIENSMQVDKPSGVDETNSKTGGGVGSDPTQPSVSTDPGAVNRGRKRAVDFMD